MIRLGKHITQADDQLSDVRVEHIYHALKNEKGEVAKLVERLKIIKCIDQVQYRRLKTNLPYLVCANFNPKIRRKENFSYTERFMIDIDHISEFGIDINALRNKLILDNNIELMFLSPGGDGLKLLFKISKKITDAAYYSIFYKTFGIQFAQQYQLGAALDLKTSDVSRCCFVSFDPNTYYNPVALAIDIENYVSPDHLNQLDFLSKEIKQVEKQHQAQLSELNIGKDLQQQEISDQVMDAIRAKVGIIKKIKSEKAHEQPEELKLILPQVLEFLLESNLTIKSNKPISYGRQVTIQTQHHWAEFNLFFGKKGIRIVETTKTGSNRDLCKMVVTLVKNRFEII